MLVIIVIDKHNNDKKKKKREERMKKEWVNNIYMVWSIDLCWSMSRNNMQKVHYKNIKD